MTEPTTNETSLLLQVACTRAEKLFFRACVAALEHHLEVAVVILVALPRELVELILPCFAAG